MPETNRPKPWLIAAWPGMGSVAVLAAQHLAHEFKMEQVAEQPPGPYFDVNEVEVKGGIVGPARLPRGIFLRSRSENWKGRELIVFIGEAQPPAGAYAYANDLLQTAQTMGVERVVTFASMATALHPSGDPKVSGIATTPDILAELRRAEVQPLGDGRIGGLNGVLLGCAAARDIPGMCLLAEIPYFAAQVPNPKAARVALSVFAVLAGLDLNLHELEHYAAEVDRLLVTALQQMQQRIAESKGAADEAEETNDQAADDNGEADDQPEDAQAAPEPAPPAGGRALSPSQRARIERLFKEAGADHSKAVELKQELDRSGVFDQYEDRFLDLFRRAE